MKKQLIAFLFSLSLLPVLVNAQECPCTVSDVLDNTVASLDTVIGTIDTVSTVLEFRSAINQANSTGGNRTILIANGTYQVASTASYPYVTASNVVFRSLSGQRDSVVLTGTGMFSSTATENVLSIVGDNVIIADLTIKDANNHGIAVQGDNLLVHNVKIQDTYEQLVKGTSGNGGADNCRVQCSLIEYTAGVGPNFYIGGLDIHDGDDWVVNDNVFRNIASPGGSLAEHAVHFWNNSSDNIVERNMIVNCDRGVGFGLGSSMNDGGIIRNNMIFNDGTAMFDDVGIGLESSPNTKVYNNSIMIEYPNAIEYRYASTTNVDIANNLTNALIKQRNGASATIYSNYTSADINWFVDPLNGNLRLNDNHTAVVDAGVNLAEVSKDFDQYARPSNRDIGAHEYIHTDMLPLMDIGHLKYEGAFIIPSGNFGNQSNYTASYSSGAIAVNSAKNSIFIAGHAPTHIVGEFSIPEVVNSSDLANLNTSENLQEFKDVLNVTTNPQSIDRISGMAVINGQLVVNGMEYYDAAADNTHTSIVIESADDIHGSAYSGYFALEGRAHAAGWISAVPREWQVPLGGSYIAGNSSKFAINSRLPMGITAFTFEPSNLSSAYLPTSVPTDTLLDFSLANPLYEDYNGTHSNSNYNLLTANGNTFPCHTEADADIETGANDLWTEVSQASYGFIVPNTRSYMTIGASGGHNSGIGYKAEQDNGNCCGGPCPYAADDEYNYYWLWDVQDLQDVRNGIQEPHDVRPYAYGLFDAPLQWDDYYDEYEYHPILGGDFDAKKGLLYLTIYDGGATGAYSRNPAIAVYRIIDEERCDGIDNNGDGQIDEHLVNTWVGPANANWFESTSYWSLHHFPNDCNHVKIGSSANVSILDGQVGNAYSVEIETGATLNVAQNGKLMVTEE